MMHPNSAPRVSPPAAVDIAALNHAASVGAARDVIELALTKARRPMVTTKFGPHSAVILHLVTELAPDIPVVWIDTGFNTRATLQFADLVQKQLTLNLRVYRPSVRWSGVVPDIDAPAHAVFAQQVKLEPFARALGEIEPDVWFSSLRHGQTQHRDAQLHFNLSKARLLKVSPLIHWSEADLLNYENSHGLLSESDYRDPTKGDVHRECGLHTRY